MTLACWVGRSGAGPLPRRGFGELIFLYLLYQAYAGDPEDLGGLGAVAPGIFQHFADVLLLDLFQAPDLKRALGLVLSKGIQEVLRQ